MASCVTSRNRVRYIEPSNVMYYDNGTEEIMPSNIKYNNPLENLNLALDLQVVLFDRKSCGIPTQTGGAIVFNYSTNRGTMSFLKGTDGILTTNYTDVNLMQPDDNTEECLGIETIDIQYQSWMYPDVTIKFVDVRGATVMSKAEKEYQDKDNGGSFSLYKALFTFPYPLFKMKVKGFYGRGATYYLSIENIKMEFNAETGNFEIIVHFIGTMFRAFADLPMTYIAAAPYTEEGRKYWDESVQNGRFQFHNPDGSTVGMMPYVDFRKRLWEGLEEMRKRNVRANGEAEGSNLKEKKAALTVIMDRCPVKEGGWLQDTKNRLFVITNSGADAKQAESAKAADFISALKSYDEAWKKDGDGAYYNLFSGLDKENLFDDPTTKVITFTKDKNAGFTHDNKSAYDTYIEVNTDIKNAVEARKSGETKKTFVVYIVTDVDGEKNKIGNFDNFINTIVKPEITSIDSRINAIESEYKELEEGIIEDYLGFRPSIKNMYDLAFAHMDTFIHIFNNCTSVIRSQMESKDKTRDVNTYGSATDMHGGDGMLPPFPALYQEIESQRNSGVTRRTEVWPGDITGGSEMAEVGLVDSLINGANKYYGEMEKLQQQIEQASNETSSGGGGTAVSARNLIPLTTYDFVHLDDAKNPYKFIADILDDPNQSLDGKGFKELFAGAFSLRAMYYLATQGTLDKQPELFGTLEAANFFKGVGLRDEKFVTDFQSQANAMKASDFISIITSENFAGINGGTLGKGKLFSIEGSGAEEFMRYEWDKGIDGKSFFPVAFESIEGCKKDLPLRKNLYGRYINVNTDDSDKNDTFFDFDGSYLSKVYEVVEAEIGSSSVETSGATEGASGILNDDETLKTYKESLNSVDFENPNEKYVKGSLNDDNGIRWPVVIGGRVNDSAKEGELGYYGRAYYQSDFITKHNGGEDDDSVLARAYIFLYSVPILLKNHGLRQRAKNGVEFYVSLLREGAYYWRRYEMDAKHKPDPIKLGSGFKHANSNEIYYPKNGNYFGFEALPGDTEYVNYTGIYNTTSKKERDEIKTMFITWAIGDKDKKIEGKFKKNIDGAIRDGSNYEKDGKKETWNLKFDKLKPSVQDALREVFFGTKTVFDYYHGFISGNDEVNFRRRQSAMEQAFNAFTSTLKKIYSQYGSTSEELATAAVMEEMNGPASNKDIRMATYLGLKQLYDKWLCAPYRGDGTWKLGHKDSEFDSFAYIDTFYHDIGLELSINADQMLKALDLCLPISKAEMVDGDPDYKNKSMYQFLTEIAQECGGMLIAFPQKIGGVSEEYMAEMFRAFPYASDWDTDSSSFVFVYSYKDSEHLGVDQYEDDGFDLTAEQVITSLSDKSGYDIPAFGVSYAKQNQAYFKNIKLSTENSIMTEEAIQATLNIASEASTQVRSISTAFGQDLYRVRTSYAYQCEFDMMGDVQVMPLMYFQLNNIPFWRGAYRIIKVTHRITNGDMVTHVTGIRMNKNALPMAAGYVTPLKTCGYSGSGAFEAGNFNMNEAEVGLDPNTVKYTNDNVIGDRSFKLRDPVDFKGIVSPSHPIVCLTPCHGPYQADRYTEWLWSKTLIDDYIIPKLQLKTYKDGTKINIQRCNKGGLHTDQKNCKMTETENLIKKYGSASVISVNPHWNVGFATYNVTMHGTNTNNRRDSETLAKQFVVAAESAKKKYMTYKTMPPGMMSGKVMNRLSKNDVLALKVKCPCVETMNWFYDYPINQMCHKVKTKSDYNGRVDWKDKDDEGKYIIGEGWLFDKEGMNAIADIHVNAIMSYLDIISKAQAVSDGSVSGPYVVPNTQTVNTNYFGNQSYPFVGFAK